MNYLHYKKNYPNTLKRFFEWAIRDIDSNFEAFFEHLGFTESIFLGEYHHIITITNPVHVSILKSNQNLFLNQNNEIEIEINDGIESVLKCIEILINQGEL